jgi:hypothetical protein
MLHILAVKNKFEIVIKQIQLATLERYKKPGEFEKEAELTLNDKPVKTSDNIFLTAERRAENTDAKYNKKHTLTGCRTWPGSGGSN